MAFHFRIILFGWLCWCLAAFYDGESWVKFLIVTAIALVFAAIIWYQSKSINEAERIKGLSALVLGWVHHVETEHSIDFQEENTTMKLTKEEITDSLMESMDVTCKFTVEDVGDGSAFIITSRDRQFRYLDQIRTSLARLGYSTKIARARSDAEFPVVYATLSVGDFTPGEKVLIDNESFCSIAEFVHYDENWLNIRFWDGSSGSVRPSYVHKIDEDARSRVAQRIMNEQASSPNPHDPEIERLKKVYEVTERLLSESKSNVAGQAVDA